jgi:ectoine hydroxylase-related dioxygenase (phytanoyl-CoA dioxygenase family)
MKQQILKEGFAILENIFTDEEINNLTNTISAADTSRPTFRKTNDLFAIRQFFKKIPASLNIVFNNKLNSIIQEIFGDGYFIVKAIYFDKPEESNWFVAYHQDLTISVVDKRIDLEGYGRWTLKQNQFAVQPPLKILENNFTIRIHLDKTNEQNGALKVVPKSHIKGICRPETIDWNIETEKFCCVDKGGMLHASKRTTNNNKRRVLHIEFSNQKLTGKLNWAEFASLNACR